MSLKVEDLMEKGAQIREMDRERANRFKELNEFLKEESNNRKSGKSQTLAMAIDMAHDELESLREEEQKQKSQLRKILDYKNEIIKRLE